MSSAGSAMQRAGRAIVSDYPLARHQDVSSMLAVCWLTRGGWTQAQCGARAVAMQRLAAAFQTVSCMYAADIRYVWRCKELLRGTQMSTPQVLVAAHSVPCWSATDDRV